VLTTTENGHSSVETTRAWQQKIPDSTLVVLPGDSYHAAASDPERCAHEMLEFISRQARRPGLIRFKVERANVRDESGQTYITGGRRENE
jgi:hypothetical protein